MYPGRHNVALIVYNDFFTDPRVKRYADTLLDAGFEVDVFAVGVPRQTRPGLRVFEVLSRKRPSQTPLPTIAAQLLFLVLATVRVGAAAVRRRYVVVHVHNMPDFLTFAGVIPKLLGAKVILDVHDTSPEAYATKFNLPLKHPLVTLVRQEELVSAAFADHVISTNDLHRASLVSHGIPHAKISIVMNLADRKLFHPNHKARAHKGLTMMYHGTIAQRLGLDLILDALSRARPDCPNLRFLLLGGGEYLPRVMQLRSEYGLEDIVRFQGSVPVEQLPEVISTADVGLIGNRLITELRENWMLPVKMLEYAAMEVPTIAPRLRIIQHYFDESNTLFYEPDNPEDLASCIRFAYHHSERLEQLKVGLRVFNSRFEWKRAQHEYLDLLDTLAGLSQKV